MSPAESRSGSNSNRVRIFGPDKLVRAAAEKRWDRVKIVCSQPYSKVPRVGAGSLVPRERRETDIESLRAGRARQSASPGNYKEARPLRSLKLVFRPAYIGILVSWREIGKGDLQGLTGIGRGIC